MTHYKVYATALGIILVACTAHFAIADEKGAWAWHSDSHKIWVNCDKGRSLQKAVSRRAQPGTTIRVRGTCKERVTIKKDWLTIEAVGGASVDGSSVGPADPEFNALITIDGARGVTIDGLTVQNSSAEGVIVKNNATATLRDVLLTNNGNVGLLVDDGRVEVENIVATANLSGIDAFNNSSLLFRGQIDLTQNTVFGLGSSNGAALEVRGAQLNLSHNGQLGIIIEGAHLAIFNFGQSQGSSITMDNNGLFGMVAVGGGRLDIVAPPPFQNTGINQVSANGNGAAGIYLANNGYIESPFGAATFTVENNPVGLLAEGDSSVAVVGGMQIKNNFGPGLQADGAGTITIVSSEGMPSPNPSEITGNGVDVNLAFGSRATFGAVIGSITCDASSMARGSATCP